MRFSVSGNFLRRARGDEVAARVAPLGAEVDHVVGVFYYVQVVFDDDDGVARIH